MRTLLLLILSLGVTSAFLISRDDEEHDENDFACRYCKRAYHKDQCDSQGIKYCKSSEQACVITKEQKLGGSVETEKDCIDPKSKYCRESRYCSGLFYETCRECCYDTMCNAAYPPAADPCDNKPCLNGADCTSYTDGDSTSFTCSCASGFTGAYCENLRGSTSDVSPDILSRFCATKNINCKKTTYKSSDYDDPCDDDPCRNDAVCHSVQGVVQCTCTPAWTGQHCQTEMDPCDYHPCENGGSCQKEGNGYKCNCRDGFSGYYCQTQDNACAVNPCKNGGQCTAHCSGYTCLCPTGYTGYNCDTPLSFCFRCPEAFGLHTDVFDCHRFYQCAGWVPFHKTCPEHLHFNDKIKKCDWPENAKCVHHAPRDEVAEAQACACEINQEYEEDDYRPSKRGQIEDADVDELIEKLEDFVDKIKENNNNED